VKWLRSQDFVAALPGRLGLALLVVVVVLFAVGVLSGGFHDDATWKPRGYTIATVCPSVTIATGKLQRATNELEDLGCGPPALRASSCYDGPRAGEMQYRACSDVLVGWPSCDTTHVDLVVHADGPRGVAYIDITRPDYAHVAHAVGHVAGLGHTTAATSYMAARPGSEWSRVSCEVSP
jgi:hypothetical protein